MKRLLILATGGTIACVQSEVGFVPGLQGQELVEQLPVLATLAKIESRQLMNLDSSEMTVADWRTMARACLEAEAYDGVVITHGTDTMCYTAAALSFMLNALDKPIVLTGAQMPMVMAGSDAPDNLVAACRVALEASPGVMVVFNNKIIHGSRAFKMYSKNRDAYVSRNFPYLGRLTEKELIFEHQGKGLDLPGERLMTAFNEDVALIKMTPATNPDMLNYVARAGYAGVVIEGFGTGGIANLNRGMLAGIHHLQELGIPVVVISQCPYDGVNLAVYGVGEQARQAGVIAGNDMTTEVAVVKLMWALGQTRDCSRIAEMMQYNYCDEITV